MVATHEYHYQNKVSGDVGTLRHMIIVALSLFDRFLGFFHFKWKVKVIVYSRALYKAKGI